MADRVEVFDVSVPAGTLASAPQTTALPMIEAEIETLEVIIPPGPSGLVGFRLQHSGQTVIPFSASGWIISDNEIIHWPLRGYPIGNKWSVQLYNTDIYPHTLTFRFLVSELGSDLPAYPQPIVDL